MAAVTIDDMRDKLLTLDQVRERFATTEPLEQLLFPTASSIDFSIEPGWADGLPDEEAPAILTTPAGTRYQLTKKALLEVGAQCGIPRGYQERLPAQLLKPQLEYWFREGFGDREFKLLSRTRAAEGASEAPLPLTMAVCRGTITPFSNLQLLDVAAERIRSTYGSQTEILADYKFQHDLELSGFRLIVPEHDRVINNTRVEGDRWCTGLDIRNSLIGLRPSVMSGYLFRYWCTNGCTDTLATTGQFTRRGTFDEADFWTWAQESVDAALAGLEGTFDAVQSLTSVPVGGDVVAVLGDLFAQYAIPVRERQRVIAAMADLDGDLTMYDIQQAITQAANMDGLSARAVEQLLGMGGHVAHAATSRCTPDHPCRRLLPDGYTPPPALSGVPAAIAGAN